LKSRLVVVTNQACIGRGVVTQEEVDGIHSRMIESITSAGAQIDGIYVCPHAPSQGCRCRKPAPGLLRSAIRDLRIDPACSWMIGDRWRDIQAAHSVGLRSVLVGVVSPVRNLEAYGCFHAANLLSGVRRIRPLLRECARSSHRP
jgi:D-glycero-D-manno-heptose 1,7-bisphosphate phosphatase